MAPRTRSVCAALRPRGGWKAPTPFEIASTPVSAAAPEAKARSDDEHAGGPDARRDGSGTSACGQVPTTHLPTPVAIMAYMATTKAYVGRAKRMPDSRTPRRFATVRRTMKAIERPTLCDSSDGTADVRASTPAATETATVRT